MAASPRPGHRVLIALEEGIFHQMKPVCNPAGQRATSGAAEPNGSH